MAALAAVASHYAQLATLSQELKRQTRGLKAKQKATRRSEARSYKRFFTVALCVLAVSGSKTDVLDRYWRRCGEEESMVVKRTGEVITHFLAMEPVAVAAMLDAEIGQGAAALKKALAFILEDETLTWVRSQNTEKGIAPGREYVLQAREQTAIEFAPRGKSHRVAATEVKDEGGWIQVGLPMASDLGSYQWSFSREEGPVADGNADEGFGITQRRSEIASQSSTPVLSYYPSLCRLLHYQKSTDPLTRHAQVSPPPEKRCRKMDAILAPPHN